MNGEFNYKQIVDGLIDIDKMIRDEFDEISNTSFKGTDQNELVQVDVRGDYVIEKIDILFADHDDETIKCAIIEAVNNAINDIKTARNRGVKSIIEGLND